MKKTILFCISILLFSSCEKDIIETPPTSLCGIWLGYEYWCDGFILEEEVILVEDLGNSFIRATKIIGDDCVQSGEVTWEGNYVEDPINNEIYILTTLYFEGGSMMTPFQMEVLDFNTMNLGWPSHAPLNFKRATLEEINKLNLNIDLEGICKPQN